MARRKRKEDEPDWVPPEFDEVGYMRQEIQGAHAAIATIGWAVIGAVVALLLYAVLPVLAFFAGIAVGFGIDRKSTRLNSSHSQISYAVFCLKKKSERREGGNRRVARDGEARAG